MPSQSRHIKRLIELFGVEGVAESAGVSTRTIYRWRKRIPKQRQATIKSVWEERGNIATKLHAEVASEYSAMKYLEKRGLVETRKLKLLERKLERSNRMVKAACRESAMFRALRVIKDSGQDLDGAIARRLANQHGMSQREVFTFFYYL